MDCKWCGTGSIGVCQLKAGTCWPTCLASTAEPSVCGTSTKCKWCEVGIGVCQDDDEICWPTSTRSPTKTLIGTKSISSSGSGTVSAAVTTSTSASCSDVGSASLSLSASYNQSASVGTVSPSPTHLLTPSNSGSTTPSISTTRTPSLTALDSRSLSSSPTTWYDRYRYEMSAALEVLILSLTTCLQAVGVMAGGSGVSSLSRVVATRNVGKCFGQLGGSIFDSAIELCTNSRDDDQLEAQGDTMIGVATVFGLMGCVMLCCVVYARVTHMPLRRAAEEMSLVSLLVPLLLAAVPAAVGGAVTVVGAPVSTDHPLAVSCGASVSVAVLGLLLGAALPALLAAVSVATLGVVLTRAVPTVDAPSGRPSFVERALYALRLSVHRLWKWVPEPDFSGAPAHQLVRTLLLEYRVLWYAAVDAVVVCLCSAFSAVGPFLSKSGCLGTGATVVALLVSQLIVCAACQPFCKTFDWIFCIATLTITAISVTLQLVYGASEDNEERQAREALLLWAAVLDLMVCILFIGPLLVNLGELVRKALTKCECVQSKSSKDPATRNSLDIPHVDIISVELLLDEVDDVEAVELADTLATEKDSIHDTDDVLNGCEDVCDDGLDLLDGTMSNLASANSQLPTDLLVAYKAVVDDVA